MLFLMTYDRNTSRHHEYSMQVLRKAHNDGSFLPNLETRDVETIVDRSLQNMVERRLFPIQDEQVEEMIPLRF